ncbi:MAG: YihY/virulence factor BrkB family protein [Gammaproteobacteria bacterium]
MNSNQSGLIARLHHRLWLFEPDLLARPLAALLHAARVTVAVIRDLLDGQISLRAMGMVYSTLLSMVPLLAISFSLMKGLGVVDNQLEPMLLNLVAPMGAQGEEIVGTILGFVNNVNAGALGSVGLIVLVWTVVSLLQKIEAAFNFIWHVSQSRNLARRFSDFFSVLLIGPLLVTAALGATGAALNNKLVQQIAAIEPFGTLLLTVTYLLPYLLIAAAFTFVYMFIANTRVRLSAAFTGALVAGILWETLGKTFGMVFGSSSTLVIYSSFAVLILFLVWLYWSWLILLIGAQVAFYVQNPQYQRSGHHNQPLSPVEQEYLALSLLTLIGQRFVAGDGGCPTETLSEEIGLPEESFLPTLEKLQQLGLLRLSQDTPALWLLSRDPDRLNLARLLDELRAAQSVSSRRSPLADFPAVRSAQQQWQAGAAAAIEQLTLRDLLADENADPDQPEPAPEG